MNILIAGDWDNGGQMIALSKALNKYTEHNARAITFKETYLKYETDVLDPTINQVKELVEWADFYILSEILIENSFSKQIIKAIHPENCILRAGGSIARKYPEHYNFGPYHKIMKTGAYHDWSLYMTQFPMANTVNMYHFDEFPSEDKLDSPPYRLMFSGTKFKSKRADIIAAAFNVLLKRDDLFHYQVLGKSWNEALSEKAKGHIQYDHSLLLGAYASNSIEAMFYHLPVFCSASGWCRTTYPDLPVIHTNGVEELVEKTINLITDPDLMTKVGNEGHDFVMKHHDAKVAVKRWEALIQYVVNEYKYILNFDPTVLNQNMRPV